MRLITHIHNHSSVVIDHGINQMVIMVGYHLALLPIISRFTHLRGVDSMESYPHAGYTSLVGKCRHGYLTWSIIDGIIAWFETKFMKIKETVRQFVTKSGDTWEWVETPETVKGIELYWKQYKELEPKIKL